MSLLHYLKILGYVRRRDEDVVKRKIGVVHVSAALSVRNELFLLYIEFYGHQNQRGIVSPYTRCYGLMVDSD